MTKTTQKRYRIKAVMFDFDGTLTLPGAIDFKFIKSVLGCPPDQPVLEFIHALPGPLERLRAMEKLNRFEIDGAAGSIPNSGARDIVGWIQEHRLPLAIITRNSREAVMRAMDNFKDLSVDDFDIIITRDDPLAPKPSGQGIVWAAEQLNVHANEVLMVGDFIFDMQAGLAAGALTAWLAPNGDAHRNAIRCDFRIRSLDQLRPIILEGLPSCDGAL